MSLALAALTTSALASFEVTGMEPQSLAPTISTDPARRCLYVALDIPDSSSVESSIHRCRVSVADRPVPALPDGIIIPVCRGIRTPRRVDVGLTLYAMSPCVTQNSLVFAPIPLGPDVVIYDGNRAPLSGIPFATLGLSHSNWSAYARCSAPSSSSVVVVGSDKLDHSRLVCVDPCTLSVRWSTAPDAFFEYCSVAALPAQCIAVVLSNEPHPSTSGELLYHRLSDGVRVGSLSSVGGGSHHLAADPATGLVWRLHDL